MPSSQSLNHKLLALVVNQFQKLHGRLPLKIVLTPAAAMALAMKQAYGTHFMGVELEAAPFSETEIAQPGTGTRLGVLIHGSPEVIRACDLR